MEIHGTYNTAIAKLDELDEHSIKQIETLCSQKIFKDSKIRIMPDSHAGKGCVIGFTANLKNKIIPNLVGVDISCSISAYKLDTDSIDFTKLDKFLHYKLPHGVGIRKNISELVSDELRERVIEANFEIGDDEKMANRDLLSIGSLGSGNHFLEVNRDSSGSFWFSIHCGSRNFGLRVCNFHQKRSVKDESIPIPLRYIEGNELEAYVKHVKVAHDFALTNHNVILSEVCDTMNWNIVDSVFTYHNYIEFLDNGEYMIRKGAISAKAGERVMIPMNMRDGSLIGVGKGNPDWNYSAPHGAGRVLSRKEAFEKLQMNDFKREMDGIWSTCVCECNLDESPMAYKPMREVEKYLGETVEITDRIVPVYNFKASS